MKYYILLLGILFFVTGCSKENDLTPSPAGKNWFQLEDDSADRVQHAAYEVYTEWGIPVFCHDTIGSEERGTDHDGNIIVFHKVLDLNYGNYISDYTSNYLYIKSTQMYHIFYKYLYLCV